MKTGFSVMDAMTKRPVSVKKELSVQRASQIMEESDVGSLLVVDAGKIIGIVVEEDIVRRVVAKNKVPRDVQIKDIMTKHVITIKPNVDIYNALVVMRDNNIRQLPVVIKDELVGMLTVKDILKIEPDLFDIASEKWDIRESDQKPVFGESRIQFID